MGEYKSD